MVTSLLRWEPFRELAALQNDMSRLMGALTAGEGSGNGGSRTWVPAVDMWETERELVYAFDLPGVDKDKINVELENDTLTVSAERERSQEVSKDGFYRFERRYGTFTRGVTLPQGITEDTIKADYRDGVLEIRVPKPEEPKPRRIQIGGAEQKTIEGKATQQS